MADIIPELKDVVNKAQKMSSTDAIPLIYDQIVAGLTTVVQTIDALYRTKAYPTEEEGIAEIQRKILKYIKDLGNIDKLKKLKGRGPEFKKLSKHKEELVMNLVSALDKIVTKQFETKIEAVIAFCQKVLTPAIKNMGKDFPQLTTNQQTKLANVITKFCGS